MNPVKAWKEIRTLKAQEKAKFIHVMATRRKQSLPALQGLEVFACEYTDYGHKVDVSVSWNCMRFGLRGPKGSDQDDMVSLLLWRLWRYLGAI